MNVSLRYCWSRLWQAVVNFRRDNALDLAAGIAFYSLLSLGPLIYLLGAALSRLFSGRMNERSVAEQLSAFLPADR